MAWGRRTRRTQGVSLTVLPNQRRSGCTRAGFISRTVWPTARPPLTIFPVDLSRLTFVRYMFSLLIVDLLRRFAAPAFALSLGLRSGLDEAAPPVRFPPFFCDVWVAIHERC